MSEREALSKEEEVACTAAFIDLQQGAVSFFDAATVAEDLQSIWYGSICYRRAFPEPSSRPPEWLLGMSSDFRKAVKAIDRKLQGRLLEATTHILSEPLTPRGDTIQPLLINGDMRGLWRYRIGDFRILYHPDQRTRRILLVAFSPRGDAYA